jgi:carboxyl-terminal processing protease
MTRLARVLAALAAGCLLSAAGASFAAANAITDEALAPLTSAYVRAAKPGEQADLYAGLFPAVLQRVQRSYAREVDVNALVAEALKAIEPLEPQSTEPLDVFRKAINAALATLDPHSRYLDARAQSNYRSAITGTFGGLGLQVDMVQGMVRIVAPMPESPASRAGLQAGDLIVRFDDKPVQGLALADAVLRMRGDPGTPIALTIRREGHGDDFTVSLVRETIRTPALRSSMEGDVLVLRLTTFTGSVTGMLEKALTEASAKATTPRAVILDMRGNGGGLLRAAVSTADAFLSEGVIVSLRGRTPGNQRTWQADPAEYLAGVPMVVLIDGRSASASELVAAALQENGRAIVMGQRSFGKGSVQSILPLGDKGALRLTTALYHGPSGRTVQRTGVAPDIELVAATASASARRDAARPRALPGADEPPPPKARVEQSRCAPPHKVPDPALACALAFINAGGIDPFLVALDPAEAISH